jgi:hypothetical protein
MTKTVEDAISLLRKLGAKERLLIHIKLVDEASEILIKELKKLGVRINGNLIRIGVVVHDAGKIIHPEELAQPGNQHEQSGFELLLKNDVQPEIARFCLSHARWRETECSFEELLVALADNLWKGKREEELELMVVDQTAKKIGKNRWDIFTEMDSCFESIAADGPTRLHRSK